MEGNKGMEMGDGNHGMAKEGWMEDDWSRGSRQGKAKQGKFRGRILDRVGRWAYQSDWFSDS